MIATDHFVFVHLHTCGDRFANEVLLRSVPDARPIASHLPWRLVPPPLSRLPALGFVRNPWQYYALWYSLHAQRPQPGPIFRAMSENGTLDFEPTVRNLLELGVSSARLNAVLANMPPRFTGVGLNLPAFALESIRDSQLGFFSFLHNHMYDGPGVIHIRRVENLGADLLQILTVLGQPVSSAIRAFVASPESNTPPARDYVSLYSDALRDLVAERDATLIARYGYRFGG